MGVPMETNQEKKVIIHDIRGQICPSCLLFTLREVNKQREELKKDRIKIIIKTDNRNATTTIPEAIASMGYHFTVEKKDEGFYQIEIMSKNQ